MAVTSTNPLSTTTPDRAIKPTAAEMESGISRKAKAMTPPVNANGTPVNTNKLLRILPKAMKIMVKINNNATGTTTIKRLVADCICSNVPPQDIQ